MFWEKYNFLKSYYIMDPKIWGFCGWKFLYSTALMYPKEPSNQVKMNYMNFYNSIEHVIPCDDCGDNYGRHAKILPIDQYLESRNDLFTWVLRMNNSVNKLKGYKLLNPIAVFQYHFNFKPHDISTNVCKDDLDSLLDYAVHVMKETPDKNRFSKNCGIRNNTNSILLIGIGGLVGWYLYNNKQKLFNL